MAHNLPYLAYKLTGPGIDPGTTGTQSTIKLEKIVSQAIGILTIVAIIYFAFQIIFAGYAFITSDGDKSKMETARKRLTEGVLGVTIVFVAVVLASLLAKLMGVSNILDLDAAFRTLGL